MASMSTVPCKRHLIPATVVFFDAERTRKAAQGVFQRPKKSEFTGTGIQLVCILMERRVELTSETRQCHRHLKTLPTRYRRSQQGRARLSADFERAPHRGSSPGSFGPAGRNECCPLERSPCRPIFVPSPSPTCQWQVGLAIPVLQARGRHRTVSNRRAMAEMNSPSPRLDNRRTPACP